MEVHDEFRVPLAAVLKGVGYAYHQGRYVVVEGCAPGEKSVQVRATHVGPVVIHAHKTTPNYATPDPDDEEEAA